MAWERILFPPLRLIPREASGFGTTPQSRALLQLMTRTQWRRGLNWACAFGARRTGTSVGCDFTKGLRTPALTLEISGTIQGRCWRAWLLPMKAPAGGNCRNFRL